MTTVSVNSTLVGGPATGTGTGGGGVILRSGSDKSHQRLSKPNKKLCFREPEVVSCSDTDIDQVGLRDEIIFDKNISRKGGLKDIGSFDELDGLEAEALKIVQSVGKAFDSQSSPAPKILQLKLPTDEEIIKEIIKKPIMEEHKKAQGRAHKLFSKVGKWAGDTTQGLRELTGVGIHTNNSSSSGIVKPVEVTVDRGDEKVGESIRVENKLESKPEPKILISNLKQTDDKSIENKVVEEGHEDKPKTVKITPEENSVDVEPKQNDKSLSSSSSRPEKIVEEVPGDHENESNSNELDNDVITPLQSPPPMSKPTLFTAAKNKPIFSHQNLHTPPPSPIRKTNAENSSSENFFVQQEIQILKEKLEQQRQQTQTALCQINLLNNQLLVEQRGRVEAQARNHQLLLHNKELLDHLQNLVSHIQQLEGKSSLTSLNNNNNFHNNNNNNFPNFIPAFPQAGSTAQILSFQELEFLQHQNLLETCYEQNRNYMNNCSLSPTSPMRNFFQPSYANQSLVLGNQLQPPPTPTPPTADLATCFTAKGDPVDPIIRPLDNSISNLRLDQNGAGPADSNTLRRGVIGRSVSEKIGHKSELVELSGSSRGTWARHTTK